MTFEEAFCAVSRTHWAHVRVQPRARAADMAKEWAVAVALLSLLLTEATLAAPELDVDAGGVVGQVRRGGWGLCDRPTTKGGQLPRPSLCPACLLL